MGIELKQIEWGLNWNNDTLHGH